jgi:hypothetical protein
MVTGYPGGRYSMVAGYRGGRYPPRYPVTIQ